jgi:hypothetical protein
MPIRQYLEGGSFDPTDIQLMSLAFEDVCKALSLPANDTNARRVIATRIVELARRGERDPNQLRDRVIREAHSSGGS